MCCGKTHPEADRWPIQSKHAMRWLLALAQDSLALGVIFAATDSVAVLQVLRPDRAPLLYSLVFGEGVINDATAVALLRAVQVSCSCIAPASVCIRASYIYNLSVRE